MHACNWIRKCFIKQTMCCLTAAYYVCVAVLPLHPQPRFHITLEMNHLNMALKDIYVDNNNCNYLMQCLSCTVYSSRIAYDGAVKTYVGTTTTSSTNVTCSHTLQMKYYWTGTASQGTQAQPTLISIVSTRSINSSGHSSTCISMAANLLDALQYDRRFNGVVGFQ